MARNFAAHDEPPSVKPILDYRTVLTTAVERDIGGFYRQRARLGLLDKRQSERRLDRTNAAGHVKPVTLQRDEHVAGLVRANFRRTVFDGIAQFRQTSPLDFGNIAGEKRRLPVPQQGFQRILAPARKMVLAAKEIKAELPAVVLPQSLSGRVDPQLFGKAVVHHRIVFLGPESDGPGTPFLPHRFPPVKLAVPDQEAVLVLIRIMINLAAMPAIFPLEVECQAVLQLPDTLVIE